MSWLSYTSVAADRDLIRRIIHTLNFHHGLMLGRLHILAANGIVTLEGTVGSLYHRRLCASCCSHMPGVRQVRDEMSVAQLC